MTRLSKLLQFRNQLVQKNVIQNDVGKFLQHGITTCAASFSAARENLVAGKVTGKVYATFSIYKGKASLSATPVSPTFIRLESGHIRLDRSGVILLSFCPAIGNRKYDFEKKKFFALSATEIGSLVNLGSKDSCEFFHDPSMQSSSAGQVRKSLTIKPQADGNGYMISLSVVDNNSKSSDRIYVPVSPAEFTVLRTACSYALPHIMGWDQLTAQFPHEVPDKRSQFGGSRPQLGGSQPQLGGSRPQLGGSQPQLGGPRPQLGGSRPKLDVEWDR